MLNLDGQTCHSDKSIGVAITHWHSSDSNPMWSQSILSCLCNACSTSM